MSATSTRLHRARPQGSPTKGGHHDQVLQVTESLHDLRVRNNRLEREISRLKPEEQSIEAYQTWEFAMTLVADQFYAISRMFPQPLGSTRSHG